MSEITVYLLINLLRTYINLRYVRAFFDKEDSDKWREFWGFCFFFIMTGGGYIIFRSLEINIVTNLLGLIVMSAAYRGSWKKKFLVAFLIYSICIACDAIVMLVLSGYGSDGIGQIHEILSVIVQLMGQIVLEKGIRLKKIPEYVIPQWMYLLMLPVFSTGVIYYLAKNHSFSDSSLVILGICFLYINVIIVFLYSSMEDMYVKNMEYRIFEQRSKEYAHQLDIIMQTQEQLRSLQHDMKHHIRELAALAGKKQNEEVLEYLNKMENFTENPDEFVCSGNAMIDSNLNYLLKKAHEVLKVVEVEMKIPENLNCYTFELNVILGNLLENAIEAASRTEEKVLRFHMKLFKGTLLIMIKNSYDGKLNNGDGIPKTLKMGEGHGYGLKNVEYIIEKNQGEITIHHTDAEFQVDIFLYME